MGCYDNGTVISNLILLNDTRTLELLFLPERKALSGMLLPCCCGFYDNGTVISNLNVFRKGSVQGSHTGIL